MANHQQHTAFSSMSGLLFGTLAWFPGGFPATTCMLAGGLCGVGGMLPDIDIKTSRSFQDCMSITACIASMLVILRVSAMGVSAEMISIIGTAVFIAVKFGIGRLIQSFTTHRGLIHSIPFCLFCGVIIFLTMTGDFHARILKAAGLSLGFFSHLLLDEIYSVDVVKLSTKKSFGTAIKFGMHKQIMLTAVLYFLLFCTIFVSFKQPNMVGEALDHTLDKIAELTIRGTQQLEVASSLAQDKLRGTGSIPHETATPTDGLLAQSVHAPNNLQQDSEEPLPRRFSQPMMVSTPIVQNTNPNTAEIPLSLHNEQQAPLPVQMASVHDRSPPPLQRPLLLIEERP